MASDRSDRGQTVRVRNYFNNSTREEAKKLTGQERIQDTSPSVLSCTVSSTFWFRMKNLNKHFTDNLRIHKVRILTG